jgi:hypothetical protein
MGMDWINYFMVKYPLLGPDDYAFGLLLWFADELYIRCLNTGVWGSPYDIIDELYP